MVDQNGSSKLYGFYNFMFFKTRKRKKSKFIMIKGPSSLQNSAGVHAMFNSL